MPYVTGKDGEFTLDGVQAGGLVDWEAYVLEVDAIRNDGQGDDWRSSVHLVNGWEGTATLEMALTQRLSYMPLVGTEIEVTAKIAEADVTSFLIGLVKVTRAGVRVRRTDKVEVPVEFEGIGAPTTVDGAPYPPPP